MPANTLQTIDNTPLRRSVITSHNGGNQPLQQNGTTTIRSTGCGHKKNTTYGIHQTSWRDRMGNWNNIRQEKESKDCASRFWNKTEKIHHHGIQHCSAREWSNQGSPRWYVHPLQVPPREETARSHPKPTKIRAQCEIRNYGSKLSPDKRQRYHSKRITVSTLNLPIIHWIWWIPYRYWWSNCYMWSRFYVLFMKLYFWFIPFTLVGRIAYRTSHYM